MKSITGFSYTILLFTRVLILFIIIKFPRILVRKFEIKIQTF